MGARASLGRSSGLVAVTHTTVASKARSERSTSLTSHLSDFGEVDHLVVCTHKVGVAVRKGLDHLGPQDLWCAPTRLWCSQRAREVCGAAGKATFSLTLGLYRSGARRRRLVASSVCEPGL